MHSRWWAVGLLVFFVILIVFVVAGRSAQGTVVVNGVTYELDAPSETVTGIPGGVTIRANGHTITDSGGNLTVDAARCGRVGPGDRVTMSADGSVTINGKAHTPAPSPALSPKR